ATEQGQVHYRPDEYKQRKFSTYSSASTNHPCCAPVATVPFRVFFAAIFGSLSSLVAKDEMPLLYEPLIESSVRGLSFADVGGLWNTENEMVSHAIKGGASRAVMIDMQPENNEWWQ